MKNKLSGLYPIKLDNCPGWQSLIDRLNEELKATVLGTRQPYTFFYLGAAEVKHGALWLEWNSSSDIKPGISDIINEAISRTDKTCRLCGGPNPGDLGSAKRDYLCKDCGCAGKIDNLGCAGKIDEFVSKKFLCYNKV